MLKAKEASAVSKSIVANFPQFTFLKKLSSDPYLKHYVFDKNDAKHCILHSVNIDAFYPKTYEYFSDRIKLTPDLKHPNLYSCHHVEEGLGMLHIVTEESNLCPLDEAMEGTRLTLKRTLEVGIQICGVLEYLHLNNMSHSHLSVNDVLLDRHYFVKLSPAYFGALMSSVDAPDSGVNVSLSHEENRMDDMESLGKILIYMSTGYRSEEISSTAWESFGVHKLLIDIICSMVAIRKSPKAITISEVMSALEEIQTSLYSEDETLAGCNQARHNRTLLTKRWTPDDFEEVSSKSGQINFKERFEIESCVLVDFAETLFVANDHEREDVKVWLHVFECVQTDSWESDFKDIVTRLEGIKNPHISRVYSSGIMNESAFIVSQNDPGERLTTFVQRHQFTQSEVLDLAAQLCEALSDAKKLGFYNCHLSDDTVCVYKTSEGLYHYRLIATGYVSLLRLSGKDDDDAYKNIMTPVFMTPELYDGQSAKFASTQYLLGTLLYKAITGYHPCQNLSMEDAYRHHSSYCKYSISEFRKDIPSSFQGWLDKLLNSNPCQRFDSAEKMIKELNLVSLDFPIV